MGGQDGYDIDIIRLTGRVIGYQLRSLGIHVLMGPVLDIDSTAQGDYLSAVGTRSFGGDIKRVFVSSSHYIRGLQEGRIFCFGKHFPGHGAVVGNPHSLTMPTYEGGLGTLKEHLEPYPQFIDYLDGVMTSHILITAIDTVRPVTFSNEFVSKLLRCDDKATISDSGVKCLNYSNQIIITDDLSDMGSIIKYMQDNKKTFAQIAIEAFDAGHDMLLFSHVEAKDQKPRGRFKKFTLSELKEVKAKLTEHIMASQVLQKQLKNSLRRILKLKAKINKSYQLSNGKLFAKDEIIWQDYARKDITNPKHILKKHFHNMIEFLNNVFTKSYFIIFKSKKMEYSTNKLDPNAKITFYINEKYIELFRREFSKKFLNAKFISVPRYKGQWFKEQKLIMVNEIKTCNQMYYTLSDIDDRNLLDNLLLKAPKEVVEKLVILIHTTPSILTPQMLPSITTLGNFSQHPMAYKIDIDVISGRIEPNSLLNLPINLGVNATFHDISKVKFDLEPAEGFSFIPFFSTEYEFKLWHLIKKLQFMLIIVLIVIFIFAGYKFLSTRKYTLEKIEQQRGSLVGGEWKPSHEYDYFTNNPKLFIWLVISIVSFFGTIYFFLQLEDKRFDMILTRIKCICDIIRGK